MGKTKGLDWHCTLDYYPGVQRTNNTQVQRNNPHTEQLKALEKY